MKRLIALLFLLIPSVIILGHAIIPHHDDNNILLHQGNDNADEHNGAVSCLLSQVYVKINKEEQLFQAVDFDFDFVPCLLSLFSGSLVSEITDLISLPFRQKPYLRFYHAELISLSLGLRAPPVF
jgi:hypothetical protein